MLLANVPLPLLPLELTGVTAAAVAMEVVAAVAAVVVDGVLLLSVWGAAGDCVLCRAEDGVSLDVVVYKHEDVGG